MSVYCILFLYFIACTIFYFSSEADRMDFLTMKDLRKCSQKVGKSGVETTAYLRALGEAKGLNVKKHRRQVEKEIDEDVEEGLLFTQ